MDDDTKKFLQALRPNGPWTLSAIHPDIKGAVPTLYTNGLVEAAEFLAQASRP